MKFAILSLISSTVLANFGYAANKPEGFVFGIGMDGSQLKPLDETGEAMAMGQGHFEMGYQAPSGFSILGTINGGTFSPVNEPIEGISTETDTMTVGTKLGHKISRFRFWGFAEWGSGETRTLYEGHNSYASEYDEVEIYSAAGGIGFLLMDKPGASILIGGSSGRVIVDSHSQGRTNYALNGAGLHFNFYPQNWRISSGPRSSFNFNCFNCGSSLDNPVWHILQFTPKVALELTRILLQMGR